MTTPDPIPLAEIEAACEAAMSRPLNFAINASIWVPAMAAEIRRLRAELHEARAWTVGPAIEAIKREAMDESKPRMLTEWHEDDGPVLCFTEPIDEPPYCGTPLDDEFPWASTPLAEIMFVPLPRLFREATP